MNGLHVIIGPGGGKAEYSIFLIKGLAKESEVLDVQLSAYMVESILSGLKSDKGGRSDDGRIHPRVGLRATAAVLPWPLDASARGENVQVRDLSRGGISFTCSKPIHASQQFVIFFANPNGTPAAILCEAAHVKTNGPSNQTVGAKFIRTVRGAIKGLQAQESTPAAKAS